jgi:hypothetical protein
VRRLLSFHFTFAGRACSDVNVGLVYELLKMGIADCLCGLGCHTVDNSAQ